MLRNLEMYEGDLVSYVAEASSARGIVRLLEFR